MQEFLEAAMVISFGISWPASIHKSWRSGTAKGKSLFFLIMVLFGYACGIAGKFIAYAQTGIIRYPAYFYVLNFLMVLTDIALYVRNRRLDKQTEMQYKRAE